MTGPEYACENDACPYRGKVQHLPAGGSSDCSQCGWSMSATYPSGGMGTVMA